MAPSHHFGPHIRTEYVIHLVQKGKGTFRCGQDIYHLTENMAFLIYPGIDTEYEADIDCPWSYAWVGFNGIKAYECTAEAGFSYSNPVVSLTRFNVAFCKRESKRNYQNIRPRLQAEFCPVFDRLARNPCRRGCPHIQYPVFKFPHRVRGNCFLYLSWGISILLVILFLYVFPVIAAFSNTTARQVKNAFAFAFMHFFYTGNCGNFHISFPDYVSRSEAYAFLCLLLVLFRLWFRCLCQLIIILQDV